MPEYCTCGTKLVEDARFCHRCGRPTREIEVADIPPALPTPQPQLTLQQKLAQLPVSFGNPIALRVGFLMSLGIMFLDTIPVVQVLFVIWWLAGGWCGVLVYRRLTGRLLSIAGGARLGSITGVLAFVTMFIEFTLGMVFGGKEVLESMAKQDPRLAPFMTDLPAVALGFLFMMLLVFALVVGVCAAGGALGARFSGAKAEPG